jgi:hypothetical protein
MATQLPVAVSFPCLACRLPYAGRSCPPFILQQTGCLPTAQAHEMVARQNKSFAKQF